MSLTTGSWNSLGDELFYRRVELYQMTWSDQYGIDLKDFKVKVAPFGGPIVLTRAETQSKTASVDLHTGYVFSPSSELVSTIKDLAKNAALVGWTVREDIFTVGFDGHVTIYSIYGQTKHTFLLDQEIRETKILECQDFNTAQGTGIALITSSYRFVVVNNIYDARVRRLAEIPNLSSAPNCWRAISQSQRETQVLVATGSSLYLLKSSDKTCTPLNLILNTPYTNIWNIAVSMDSSRIAILADNGQIWQGALKEGVLVKDSDFDTKSKVKADQFIFAGNEALAALFKNVLLIVGRNRHYFNYVIDPPVVLAEEIDGLRIIEHFTHDFLQRIPDVTYNTFRIGSISAGALLMEASKEFEARTHKADEYIKILRDRGDHEIAAAVEQCILAAGHEISAREQKNILRAAAFGKNFSPEENRDLFVEMCQKIRVLNAVRLDPNVAIPITHTQLEQLSMKVLLDRLILRRHYPLAIKLSDYLKIPENEGRLRILGNWASNKVQETHLDDDEVATLIYNKLQLSSGISYSDIANQAIQKGRKQLAIRLLDFETRASQQVPLLLLLDQYLKALTRAIESGDTHLIYTVIYRLKESMSPKDFSMTIRNYPQAYALYQKLCKQEDPEKLRDLHYQEDDFNAEAVCWIIDSYNCQLFEQRLSALKSAAESFKKSRNDFAATQTDNQVKLLKYQEKLKRTIRLDCMNDSVQQTIEKLLLAKEYKLAEDLKKEFKVPDKRFWWVKIRTLATEKEWIELERFSKSKRSPIGYEPFVDECLRNKNRYEAQKYAPRVDENNRVTYLTKVGLYEEAVKFAIDKKDFDQIDHVINKAGPSERNKLLALKHTIRK